MSSEVSPMSVGDNSSRRVVGSDLGSEVNNQLQSSPRRSEAQHVQFKSQTERQVPTVFN